MPGPRHKTQATEETLRARLERTPRDLGSQRPGRLSLSHTKALCGLATASLTCSTNRCKGSALAGSMLGCVLNTVPLSGTKSAGFSRTCTCPQHFICLSQLSDGSGERMPASVKAVPLPRSAVSLGSRPGCSKGSVCSHGLALLWRHLPRASSSLDAQSPGSLLQE